MLATLRRRLGVTTWVILSAQSLALGLGTAQVCAEREHTHGALAAADCSMHHSVEAGHAHHDGDAAPHADGAPRISCRCPSEVPATYLGHNAIVEERRAAVPCLEAAVVTPPAARPYCDYDVLPPSPPPR